MERSILSFSKVISLIIFTASVIFSQNDPYYVLEIKYPLKSISFVNANTGYIYGSTVKWKTTDGGVTWKYSLNDPYYVGLSSPNSVVFISDSLALAAKDNWDVLKTTNCGMSWFNLPTVIMGGKSIFFINNTTGWLYGDSYAYDTNILQTFDKGNTWNRMPNPGLGAVIKSLFYINESKGYAVGTLRDTFAVTNDFGITWTKKSLGTLYTNYKQVYFADENHGWLLTDYYKLFRTTKAGNNWDMISLSVQVPKYMVFKDSMTGWIIGNNWEIVKTTDGGQNWTRLGSTLGRYLESIYFKNENTGWVIGNDGYINKTTNGGVNWIMNQDLSNQTLVSCTFNDINTGWVSSIGDDKSIWKTTNSGHNWERKFYSSSVDINSIYFFDNNMGLGAGSYGYIFYTSNGGNNWTPQVVGLSDHRSVKFYDSNTGWAVGNYGQVFKSTNGGINWNLQSSDVTSNLNSVYPVSQNKCLAVGNNSLVLKTTDSGNNWDSTYLSDLDHRQIYFINQNTGFIISSKFFYYGLYYYYTINKIFKTTDSGESWNQVYSDYFSSGHFLNSISFVDSLSGIVVGQNGRILKTLNGGSSWTEQNYSDIFPNFISLACICNKNNFGWIIGDFGTLLTTSNNTTGIKQISTNIPNSFKLYQNYPNPYNPFTKIRFDVKIKSNISIKLYDINGREMAVLLNGIRETGSYEIELKADEYGLASGIYFNTLESDDFSQSNKMVLIK